MSHNQAVTDSISSLYSKGVRIEKQLDHLLMLYARHLRVEHGMSLAKIAKALEIKYGIVLRWHKLGRLR